MTGTVPHRDDEARMKALEKANDVRSRRAGLKRDIKAGRKNIADLLTEPPEYIETMKVLDLLLATPRWGRVKVNKTLAECRISPHKHVAGLSPRQRYELVEHLCARMTTRGSLAPATERFRAQMSESVHQVPA